MYLSNGHDSSQPYGLYAGFHVHAFAKDSVYHMLEPDINQEVYGIPEYFSALQSVWLNESATLFRRKYYLNGSHAGYILYVNDENIEDADIDALTDSLKQSKGPGNFRNLLLYAPGGKEKGVQLIPIGEVMAKDEFSGVKNISRDDILVAHRIPPQLLGMVPSNSGGFGSIKDAAQVFFVLEINPLIKRFTEINEWAGVEAVKFKSTDEIIDRLLKKANEV